MFIGEKKPVKNSDMGKPSSDEELKAPFGEAEQAAYSQPVGSIFSYVKEDESLVKQLQKSANIFTAPRPDYRLASW